MLRHIPQPGYTGILEAYVRVKASSNSVVDDGLLLLVQERYDSALGLDGAIETAVGPVEETDDGGLLGGGREGRINLFKIL